MAEKFCNSCKTVKTLEIDFGKDRWSKSGFTDYCKKCRNARAKARILATGGHKPRNDLYRENRKKYYQRSEVKDRVRDQWFQKQYGISLRDYEVLVRRQGGTCAMCGNTPADEPKEKRLAVDHCHETNTIRGLLCQNCNRGIGLLGDSVAILEKAIAYLKRNRFKEAL